MRLGPCLHRNVFASIEPGWRIKFARLPRQWRIVWAVAKPHLHVLLPAREREVGVHGCQCLYIPIPIPMA